MSTEFIHYFTPGSNGRTFLSLHGNGGDEHSLDELISELDPEAGVVAPRGRSLDEGYPRFFRRLAEGVFDLNDLKVRTAELAGFVDFAVREYGIDRAGLTAVGYSNGANIAASLMLLHPTVLRSAILFRAMLPIVPDEFPDLGGSRILILSGDNDMMIPHEKAEALGTIFESAGATISHRWQSGGHQLSYSDILISNEWLGTN
jgi:phospholipase/carboxylesterase